MGVRKRRSAESLAARPLCRTCTAARVHAIAAHSRAQGSRTARLGISEDDDAGRIMYRSIRPWVISRRPRLANEGPIGPPTPGMIGQCTQKSGRGAGGDRNNRESDTRQRRQRHARAKTQPRRPTSKQACINTGAHTRAGRPTNAGPRPAQGTLYTALSRSHTATPGTRTRGEAGRGPRASHVKGLAFPRPGVRDIVLDLGMRQCD